MEVIEFTTNNAFNAIFSIYFYVTVIMAPIFASIAVTRN
jgi:hypothetical protein